MDWRFNTIWFEQINEENVFQYDLKNYPIKSDIISYNNIEYAIIWHLKKKGNPLNLLLDCKKLLYLELNWANINNFEEIVKFTNLKRLELHYCTKLETDFGLSSICNNLEYLHINHSKKFKPSAELFSLKNIKVLCLNDCGNLENLNFLKYFPKLIDFRFVNTNILDGDLNPILDHPTIKSVGFLNKRHYNFKDIEIDNELSLKINKDFKTYLYKDKYMTFRYNYD